MSSYQSSQPKIEVPLKSHQLTNEGQTELLEFLGNSLNIDLSERSKFKLRELNSELKDNEYLRLGISTTPVNIRIFPDSSHENDDLIDVDGISFVIDQFTKDVLQEVIINYDTEKKLFKIEYRINPTRLDISACDINQVSCGPDCC